MDSDGGGGGAAYGKKVEKFVEVVEQKSKTDATVFVFSSA